MARRRRGSVAAPTLVFTAGDPAGVGPELLLRLFAERTGGDVEPRFRSIVVGERAALERHAASVPSLDLDDWVDTDDAEALGGDSAAPVVSLVDPIGRARRIEPGRPSAADAVGAMAALECAVDLMNASAGAALVTLPINKAEIARHVDPAFRGHTDWLAAAGASGRAAADTGGRVVGGGAVSDDDAASSRAAGLGHAPRYGRDYLMTFLAADLQVALLSTHVPLRAAIESLSIAAILDALRALHRHAGGRIAVAGLNPHAGEQGLLGAEDDAIVRPAVERARAEGIDAHGPASPDSVFARARRGEFDWVLALYHDQGLIAVKTAAFGAAANWTLGLPWIRTSVDHGTAYDLASTGRADLEPLRHVVATTLALLAGDLPRGRRR